MKKITSILIATIFVFLYEIEPALANVPEPPLIMREPIAVDSAERPNTYPYKKLFAITAYYRPVPNQQHYATGSYEAEVRMNGDSHSADGTVVYPGMIAAPKSYSFGFKMYIPGIGITAVHDRGGAIVEAGKKNQEYDRLDIWVGSGDKGLERALAWGKRVKEVIVYGIDPNIKENVYLEDYTPGEQYLASSGSARPPVRTYKIFKQDVWYKSSGESVKKLQGMLYQFGYLDEQPTGFYGDKTRQAVFDFQKENDIVASWEETGAGHTGPQTRWKLELTYNASSKEKFPRIGLKASAKDPDNIKRLQEILASLGYVVDITGEYDEKTENAVSMFQIDLGILPNMETAGIKSFGPKTRKVLIGKYLAKLVSDVKDPEAGDVQTENYLTLNLQEKDLQLGDKSGDVAILQKELSRLGYFGMKPTGYFGEITKHSVFKFQQAMGLVDDEKKSYAGIFGPVTRGRLNQIIAERTYTKKLIAEKSKLQEVPQIIIAEAFANEIDFGESGEHVEKLQKTLRKLGYFNSGLVSGYFGEETRNAILKFQKDRGIVSSENDTGAGRVGPATKEALNQVMSS